MISLFIFYYTQLILAESHYVLIDGGGSKESNYYRYYNDLRRAYETLKSSNKNVSVYAKDGSWEVSPQYDETLSRGFGLDTSEESYEDPNASDKPTYPPLKGPFKTKEDLSNLLKAIQLKKGDTIVLQFFSHGGPPSSPDNKPESASITAWGNQIQFSEIKDVLQTLSTDIKIKLSTDIKIKLITTTCFGGGMHSISRELPNVCTAATTTHQFTSSSGTTSESVFSSAFWMRYQGKSGNISFAEGILNGFSADFANQGLGRISSFDYVDYVLNKGPYGKNFKQEDYIETELKKGLINRFIYSPPHDFSRATGRDSNVYESIYIPEKFDDIRCYTNGSGAIKILSNRIQQDLNRINKLAQTLQGITSHMMLMDINNKLQSQPEEIKTIFHNVLNDMQENHHKYLQIAKKYEENIQNLLHRWHEEKYNQKNTIEQIQKEYDTLRAKAQIHLRQYFFNNQMLRKLNNLEIFNEKATPEQKEKFIQLLQCEWEPL